MSELVEQIKVWKDDYPSYAEANQRIVTKGGELVKFKLNRPQRRLWQHIQDSRESGKPVRAYILKARQMGFSTMISGLAEWRTTLNRFQNALLVSHELQSATTIFEKQKVFYGMKPAELKPHRKLSNRRELVFAKDDDSGQDIGLQSRIIVSTADNVHLGASYTFQFVHLSEFARYETVQKNARLAFSTLLQAVPDLPETYVFLETTAFGLGFGKEVWDRPNDGFDKIFVSWIADDSYTAHTPVSLEDLHAAEQSAYGNEQLLLDVVRKELEFWYPNEARDSSWVQHEALKRLAWRRNKIDQSFFGNLDIFRQEYPTTPLEAFVTTGNNVFDTRRLADIKTALEGISFDSYRFIRDEQRFAPARYGNLRVYEGPVKGHRYVIGADVSEGVHDGDNSAAQVLEIPSLVQVAVYQGPVVPDLFAEILQALGYWYNGAFIAVEVNGPGFATNMRLGQSLLYPYLYWREALDGMTKSYQKRFGWHTNAKTKNVMITDLRRAVRDDLIVFRDVPTIDEMSTYIDDEGKMGAAPGYRDDLVMALGLSLQMVTQQNYGELRLPDRGRAPMYSMDWWLRVLDNEEAKKSLIGYSQEEMSWQ